jgi:ribosomal protein S18 acetylase RimI-like enzyme
MAPGDRDAIAEILAAVGNFNPEEIECALELVDMYLRDIHQKDYRLVVAESPAGRVCAYACYGPTPMTRGTYDLYWLATSPAAQGHGIGRSLMDYVEARVREEKGRLLVLETSSKDSYIDTVRFYRRLHYEEAARIRDFYDRGDDKLVFVRRLCS